MSLSVNPCASKRYGKSGDFALAPIDAMLTVHATDLYHTSHRYLQKVTVRPNVEFHPKIVCACACAQRSLSIFEHGSNYQYSSHGLRVQLTVFLSDSTLKISDGPRHNLYITFKNGRRVKLKPTK